METSLSTLHFYCILHLRAVVSYDPLAPYTGPGTSRIRAPYTSLVRAEPHRHPYEPRIRGHTSLVFEYEPRMAYEPRIRGFPRIRPVYEPRRVAVYVCGVTLILLDSHDHHTVFMTVRPRPSDTFRLRPQSLKIRSFSSKLA